MHVLTLWFVIITQSSFILGHHLPITVQGNLSHLPIPTYGHSAKLPILFARPLWSNRDFVWYIIYILYIRADYKMMPPRVLVSGPKPCGGKKDTLFKTKSGEIDTPFKTKKRENSIPYRAARPVKPIREYHGTSSIILLHSMTYPKNYLFSSWNTPSGPLFISLFEIFLIK